MWFKNLRIYSIESDLGFSVSDEIDEKLASYQFSECGPQDLKAFGFVPPLGNSGKMLSHSAGSRTMICLKIQEKILPSAAVNEQLEKKISEISESENRSVGRKERVDIKDEIIFTLLPKAITKSKLVYAYFDFSSDNDFIIIDSASAATAEILLGALREAFGVLAVTPLTTNSNPSASMTQWLRGELDCNRTELGEECNLQDPKDFGRVAKFKSHDLKSSEVQSHLDDGMIVKRLFVNWNNAISCAIDDDLSIKRVKFSDEIIGKSGDCETAEEAFDSDFYIMTEEVGGLIKDLLIAFGGIYSEAKGFGHG